MRMPSKKQAAVLKFIQDFQKDRLYSPSLEEIATFFKVKAPTIHQHVSVLEKKGYLIRSKNKRRFFEIAEKPIPQNALNSPAFDAFMIPILGSATAGSPVHFAEEHIEGYLRVSQKDIKQKKELFAVRIDGESMNKASKGGIQFSNGNFAIVDPTKRTPENNTYVLSVINGVCNIKKFRKDSNGICLLSESTQSIHKPIFISSSDEYVVNGEVVAIIEK